MKHLIFTIIAFMPLMLQGQAYTDYIGGGHSEGITVTASSFQPNAEPENTINGKGLDSPFFAASRFLSHATNGHTTQMVEDLLATDNDFEGWIDEQFALTDTSWIQPTMDNIWAQEYQWWTDTADIVNDIPPFGPANVQFHYAWWQENMTNTDLLRQKVAYALSQILVISNNSDIGGWGEASSSYYDLLLRHAFGNYRDLLEDVSYSFQMGYYLSHFNNAKYNPETMSSPDENYAREIMQLFTIGLYQLNIDGTRVVDGNGQGIPTYTQDDIQEFAEVFTGLGMSALENPQGWPFTPTFGVGTWAAKKDAPMMMYQDFHDTSEKELLNGTVLPANQPGDLDIEMAIDNLFNHPNVGPFISNLLIKRLVKSNPTPEYIARVATTFNDNGSGVRGDMKAVIKAILLDEEARSGASMLSPDAGRLREPFMRFSSMYRMLPHIAPEGRYWNNGYNLFNATGQHVLNSPTVFNFYLPDHTPVGPLADAYYTSPEMKLHNTSTAVTYVNEIFHNHTMHSWGDTSYIMHSWNEEVEGVLMDHTPFLPLADDPELLVNEFDKMFTYGQLTDETRDNIINVLQDTYWPWNDGWKMERVKAGIYYVLISPDYNIIK